MTSSHYASPDFLSIGHVSFDIHVKVDGNRTRPEPGGAAAFAALTARSLGSERAAMVTSAGPEYPLKRLRRQIEIRSAESEVSTVFEDDHPRGHRLQRVMSNAGPVPQELLGKDWRRPQVLFAGPLLDELTLDCRDWFKPQFSCLVAQGWFRTVRRDGLVSHIAPDAGKIAGPWDVIVLSEQEAASARDLSDWRGLCRMLAVTRGRNGAVIYSERGEVGIPAVRSRQVRDTTGAGDVWAAAFSIRYVETGSVAEAGRFAAAAAAVCVGRKGLRGVPRSREEVESLLARSGPHG